MSFLDRTLLPILLLMSGCSTVHQVQLGEINSEVITKGRKFEVVANETGINIDLIGGIARSAGRRNKQGYLQKAGKIWSYSQMGPRTGMPVFGDPDFADNIAKTIAAKCPKGVISGLTFIRETNSYKVVSGEMIKVIGYCYTGGKS